jgi:hypothetical protein
MRIHLGDWVTCSESRCENEGFLNVAGVKRIGELEDVEGLWVLKNWNTGKEFDMLGCFITVWKPFSRPEKENNGRSNRM